jgi:hypothetical protein
VEYFNLGCREILLFSHFPWMRINLKNVFVFVLRDVTMMITEQWPTSDVLSPIIQLLVILIIAFIVFILEFLFISWRDKIIFNKYFIQISSPYYFCFHGPYFRKCWWLSLLSFLIMLCQDYIQAYDHDTRALVSCPELLVRKLVISGLELGPSGSEAKPSFDHTAILPTFI